MPLFEAIAAESVRTIAGLGSEAEAGAALSGREDGRDAFADDDFPPTPLGAEVHVMALVHALSVARCLDPALLEAAEGALRRRGAHADVAAPATELSLPLAPPGAPPAREPGLLAEQRHLCVLWKPPGWAVTAGGPEERDTRRGLSRQLEDWVQGVLGAAWPVARDAAANYGLAHRLDRDTSGPLLCAKTYEGIQALRLRMATGGVRKEYVCLCHGWLPPEPRLLTGRLRAVRTSGGAWRTAVGPDGDRACTEVLAATHAVSESGDRVSLVHLRLHTGRMHQIRAHLSHEGHPLVGDAAYGGPVVAWCPRIFLHARTLATDIGDGPVEVTVPVPGDLRGALRALIATGRPHGAAG